jgi:chromosome segregation ATPase
MELLKKLQDSAAGPEQAARRIRELDTMIHRLKQSRRDCQMAIEEDRETINFIDREVTSINERFVPLCQRLEDRVDRAALIREHIEKITKEFNGVFDCGFLFV